MQHVGSASVLLPLTLPPRKVVPSLVRQTINPDDQLEQSGFRDAAGISNSREFQDY